MPIQTVTIAQATAAAMPRIDGFIASAMFPTCPFHEAPNKIGQVTYEGIAYREPRDLVHNGVSGKDITKVPGQLPHQFAYELESYNAKATMRTFDLPIDFDEVESLPAFGLQRWADRNVPERAARLALIEQESRLNSMLVSGNFGTNLTGGTDFTPLDVSSSDPIKELFLPMFEGITSIGGDLEDEQELVIGMTSSVFNALINSPSFQSRLGDGEDALSVRGVAGVLKGALLGRYPGSARLNLILRVATAKGKGNVNEGQQRAATSLTPYITGDKVAMVVRAKPSLRAMGDIISALKEQGPTAAETLADAMTDMQRRTYGRKYIARDASMKHIQNDDLEVHRFRFKEASDLGLFDIGLGALAVDALSS